MDNNQITSSSMLRESLRVLVVIASYGSQNDCYLQRIIEEYRSMPYRIRIIVVSNIPRSLGSDVEVRVGLPSKNPFSLPFAHKQVFAEQILHHDLFIYSEDDILITADNIEAFLEQSSVLPPHQVPGFLRIEKGSNEQIKYCDIHAGASWDPKSVIGIGGRTFAYLSNEHAACYILTSKQLEIALYSGKFLVAPYEGRYRMLETAATDPYTQCGFKKMICVSDIKRSSVHHLPNKYFTRFGLPEHDLNLQIEELLRIHRAGNTCAPLIPADVQLKGWQCLRDHYEPARAEILSLISGTVRSVLSLGCGATEVALVQRGVRVTAVPLDPVGSAVAAAKGVEVVVGDLEAAAAQLHGRTFDCLLLINVLHLIKQPALTIRLLLQFIKEGGTVIAQSPYLAGVRFLRGWFVWKQSAKVYQDAGVNLTSPALVRKWLRTSGLNPGTILYSSKSAAGPPERRYPAFLAPILSREFTFVAKLKDSPKPTK
ncbi:MAG TPA: methyltransferase domain-containing protein [Terracidiphilus sp.]|nr:methyltransferase domain-containing protein [Terracidiphilus sp.]